MPGSSIYVSGLPEGLDDNAFWQLFSVYGVVIATKYFADKRYGFVKYASVQEAERVVQTMDGFEHSGCRISVKFAQTDGKGSGKGDYWASDPSISGGYGAGIQSGGFLAGAKVGETQAADNLYIKGLPPHHTEDTLKQVFGAYGLVTSTRVLQSNATNANPTGETIALVRMGSADQAAWMVENLNGNIPQGLDRPIIVRYADAKGAKGAPMMKGGKGDGRFSPYDGVGGKGGPKGFGGVGKIAVAAAAAAPGSDLQAVLANTLAVLGQQASGGAGQVALADENGIADRDRSSLYIKGLPPEAGDLLLYRIFAPFGAVDSVHAMPSPDNSGACTGIGFVRYAKAADAATAVASVNQVPQAAADGHVLHVSIKRPKRPQTPQEVAPPAALSAALSLPGLQPTLALADAAFGAPDIDGVRPGMEGLHWSVP